MSDEEKPSGSSLYRGLRATSVTSANVPGIANKAASRKVRVVLIKRRPPSRARDDYHPPQRTERAARDERPAPRREYQSSSFDSYEQHESTPRAAREQRLYGVNACLASFAKRPEALRKVYLLESRIPQFKAVLAHCVQNKLGYRVVEDHDLAKLTSSVHHEGICMDVLPAAEENLSTWLQHLPAGPCVAIWLDGVGNPHNLGAILDARSRTSVFRVLCQRGCLGLQVPQRVLPKVVQNRFPSCVSAAVKTQSHN